MESEIFEREVTFSGKVIYKHVENGNARVELIEAVRRGEITPEQMRTRAKKLPYLFSEKAAAKYLTAIQPNS